MDEGWKRPERHLENTLNLLEPIRQATSVIDNTLTQKAQGGECAKTAPSTMRIRSGFRVEVRQAAANDVARIRQTQQAFGVAGKALIAVWLSITIEGNLQWASDRRYLLFIDN
jgi:hypothetical protein